VNFGLTQEEKKIRGEIRSFFNKEASPELVKEIALNTGATGSGIWPSIDKKNGG